MNTPFVDTSYLIALSNTKDIYHQTALKLSVNIEKLKRIWTHEGILLELGDWLAKRNRQTAIKIFKALCSGQSNMQVIPLDSELIKRAFRLYEIYSDKTVGITDCISFVVMTDKKITEALTSDKHFQQVGFKSLLIS